MKVNCKDDVPSPITDVHETLAQYKMKLGLKATKIIRKGLNHKVWSINKYSNFQPSTNVPWNQCSISWVFLSKFRQGQHIGPLQRELKCNIN